MLDFVIVGSGAAGSIVAERLTQNPACKVCLIEAGGEPPEITWKDNTWFLAANDDRNVWNAEGSIQAYSRKCPTKMGKMLGGSTGINAGLWVKGHASVYDSWDWPGFTSADVHGALHDMECSTLPGRGKGGPVKIRHATKTAIFEDISQGAQELGSPRHEDMNAEPTGSPLGHGPMDSNMEEDGTRCGCYKAFLVGAMGRPNLTVMTETLVVKVVLEGCRAVGVELEGGEVIRARSEVILSAGSYNSPQLLMLSGIGEEDHLKQHGLDVAVPLPGVGCGLADHPWVPMFFKIKEGVDLPETVQHGSLLGAGRVDGRTDSGLPPDFYVIFVARKTCIPGMPAPVEGDVIMTALYGACPKSRGQVSLASSDPKAAPKIELNYFSHPEDMYTARKAAEMARAWATSGPMMSKWVETEVVPGAAVTGEALDDFLAAAAHTEWHPCGTCRMGPDLDAFAVVDQELRVRGCKGLRVVDASVLPSIPTGNIQAPVMGVAALAAKLIEQSWAS
ncbi:unnamed protein product [Chrysoparadoxa australica]